MTDIGFIGAGISESRPMVAGIVARLQATGHRVSIAADHDQQATDLLTGEGAVTQPNAAALVANSDAIMSWVGDAAGVESLSDQIVPLLQADQLWIDLTTSDPDMARDLATTVESRGAVFADAPVFGPPQHALNGELVSLVGCRREKFNRIKQVIRPYASIVQRFGDPGAGVTAKLLNDFVAQGTAMLLAEAFENARHTDLDWRALHDIMCAGEANSAMLEQIVATTLDGPARDDQPSLASARKDVSTYRRLTQQLNGHSSCLADAVFAKLDTACKAGHGEQQISKLLTDGRDNEPGAQPLR